MHSHCPDSASSLCKGDNSSVSFFAEVPIPGDGSTLLCHCLQGRHPAPSNSCARLSDSLPAVLMIAFKKHQHLLQRIEIRKLLIFRSNRAVCGVAEQQIHFIKGQRIEKQRFFQAGIFVQTSASLWTLAVCIPASSATYCFKKPSNVSFRMVSTSPHTPDNGYKNPDTASRSRCWLSTHPHPLQGVPANPNPTNSAQPRSLRLPCRCPGKSTALQSPSPPDWVYRTAPLYHQRVAAEAGLGSYTGIVDVGFHIGVDVVLAKQTVQFFRNAQGNQYHG